MSLLSYECRTAYPCFAVAYPSDWLLDTSRAFPNQGSVELSTEDLSASVTVEWGPSLSPQAELELAGSRYNRHEVLQQQRLNLEGAAWSEVVYQGWKDQRTPTPDRVCARFTQRSGTIWRVSYRLGSAGGSRRRPAAESILNHFRFLNGLEPLDTAWRHHRYMASAQEFAFNHPAEWDVVPAVSGDRGSCSVTLPEGGVFQVSWGHPQTMEEFLKQARLDYREVVPLLERPGLALRSGVWDEVVFDGTRASADAWSAARPEIERGRFRFGKVGGQSWVMGYRLPHARLAEIAPSFDRMLASMRILGMQDAATGDSPEPRGLQLELGSELALCLSLRQSLEPVAFADRLAQEIHLLRVTLAYEGLLVPHMALCQGPHAPAFGWRLRAGNQVLIERDLAKGALDPMVLIIEALRSETPRLDALLTPRLARPELVQQLFPRSPNAYERLRALRPELNLPAITPS